MLHVYLKSFCFIIIWLGASLSMSAQTDWSRLLIGAIKAGQAYMMNDEQLAEMVKSEVEEMDLQNGVCSDKSKYTQRLKRLTGSMKDANGISLNFKVYQTTEYNAFACPDGSVRVFSALMDILNDNELLGVIGHIAHFIG